MHAICFSFPSTLLLPDIVFGASNIVTTCALAKETLVAILVTVYASKESFLGETFHC